MSTPLINYKRHRFPPEIIAHAVWLYCRFNLSLREVEEMFLKRGVEVSYETVRRWVAKFGPVIARGLCRRQPQPGDIWHLDEVVVTIKGRKFWLWRAVDQDGTVLDEILQGRRNTAAVKREIAPGIEHRFHKGLNDRAENGHLPFRKRERVMQGCRSPAGLQRFVSIHSAIRNCVSVPVRRRAALTIRDHRLEAFDAWNSLASDA
ncbi:MAG: IS6 family transposase [Marinosulfonomonas sp.]|nr:IS6 family transposase [Marinosulfonomonas sp.]